MFLIALAALGGAQAVAAPVSSAAPAPPGVPIACDRPGAGPGAGNDIIVCGRPESDERHRLPLVRDRRFDPGGTVDSVSRERNRLLGGSSGALGACTNVGPNGMTGCHNQGVWARREQRGR